MLNELLRAPMQEPNVRVGALDHLPVQLKNKTQHAVLHTHPPTKHDRSSSEVEADREKVSRLAWLDKTRETGR